MVWFERKCGAVTASNAADAFWGLGDTLGQARADATAKCTKRGATGCAIQVSQCSK